ncbi:MAG: type II toxin-antitoxin system Y4mF family antitoxin [Acidiferrobacterales bacterium]|nr:type II toxin-antitoxin system Y4mF family antitoxin [Acidiferrobacterales bacterium]
MKHTTISIGLLVRETRKLQRLTQGDLAVVCGTGKRFIVDLENGKPTCELAKVLNVVQLLGIEIQLIPPPTVDIE